MKELYRDILQIWNLQKGWKKKSYIGLIGMVMIMTILLITITFQYMDCSSLTVWSVNFWDVLFSGNMRDYYVYMQENLRGAIHTWGFGSWLMILPWAVWNFPLWLMHPIQGNLIVTDPVSIYWSKLFLLFILFIGANYIYKIIKKLTADSRVSIVAFLFMIISPEILMSVGVAGQDEILYTVLLLIAFYYWLDQKKYLFLFWSMLSVTCCPIVLIFYLLLLIIDNKNIIKIAGLLVLPMIPSLIFDFVYRNDIVYTSGKASTAEMLMDMFGYSSISTSIGSVSIAAVFLCLAYLYYYFRPLYLVKSTDTLLRTNDGIYGLTIIAVIFCIGMNSFYYRAYLYLPFIILLCATVKAESRRTNFTILAILSGVSSYVTLGMNEPLNMNTMYTTQNQIIMKICEITGSDRYTNFSSVHSKLLERFSILVGLQGVVAAGMIVLILLLLWLNRPKFISNLKFELSYRHSLMILISVMPIYLLIFYVLLFLYL